MASKTATAREETESRNAPTDGPLMDGMAAAVKKMLARGKERGYLTYDEIDFAVPVGTTGDNYDRYLVVMEEIRQSLGIVERCLEALAALGPGPVCAVDPRVPRPRLDTDPDVEFRGADGSAVPELPVGECYFALESGNGELGVYLVSDGSQTPYKLRCRPPSFLNLQPLSQMVEGALLADLSPTFELINSVAGECDR